MARWRAEGAGLVIPKGFGAVSTLAPLQLLTHQIVRNGFPNPHPSRIDQDWLPMPLAVLLDVPSEHRDQFLHKGNKK